MKMVSRLLVCLGWPMDKWIPERELKIRCGSKEYQVRPDYVLAPNSNATSTPGKAYAVIEAKRSLSNTRESFKAAQEQARTYADYLRVPFYAVADASRIKIWVRHLHKIDELILELEYKDLVKRRDYIEKLLGFDSLPDIVTRLRADQKLSVAEVLQQPRAQRGDVFLHVCNGQMYATSDAPEGPPTDAAFWWGPLDNPANKRRRITLNWDRALETCPDFVDLICRLLLHDGVNALHVRDPDTWRRSLKDRPLLITESQRTVSSDLPGKIQPSRGEVPDPGDTSSNGTSLESWTRTLSASLDEWVIKRTEADLDVLFQQGEISDIELSTWTKPQGLLTRLSEQYDSKQINVDLLRAVVHAQTGDNAKRHASLARVRLGPASRRALVEGLLFGLALSATFESMELFADRSAEDLNLRYHQNGRGLVFGLDGLQRHGDLPLTNEWGRVFRSANVLALTRLSRNRIELCRNRTMGSPRLFSRGTAPTMGEKPHHLGIIFTFDDDTRNQAAKGWDALQAALVRQYDAQIDPRGVRS